MNTDCHIPLPQPITGTKEVARSTAPINSQVKVTMMIYFISFFIPSKFTEPADCITSLRWESETRFCMYIKKTDRIVMRPRPPICISTSIIAWPKYDQWLAVSTAESPVTHVALVAVKKAAIKSTSPEFEAAGMHNNAVPTTMTENTLMAISAAGGNFSFFVCTIR